MIDTLYIQKPPRHFLYKLSKPVLNNRSAHTKYTTRMNQLGQAVTASNTVRCILVITTSMDKQIDKETDMGNVM